MSALLYNHILASVAPDTGEMTYFTPLRGGFRTYLNGTFCCSGSGIENTPRYNEGIYYRDGDNLWVNLYIPSELDWRKAGHRAASGGGHHQGRSGAIHNRQGRHKCRQFQLPHPVVDFRSSSPNG